MRVVAGRLGGRPLAAPKGAATRPTSDRVREALFNILAHGKFDGWSLTGAIVLDACCGTGALGCEALSRGAAHATFIDKDAEAVTLARANLKAIRAEARGRVERGDVMHPPRPDKPASLVFLDPPYGENLASPMLEALQRAGWIAPGAVVCVELGPRDSFTAPPGFVEHDRRKYGKTTIAILVSA